MRIKGLAELTLDTRPIGTPLSEGHMVMAFSAALAKLDIRIGVGPNEVAPNDALEALRWGLQATRADAQRDLREKNAAS